MYCKNCGVQIKEGAIFCTSCGTKMIKENADEVILSNDSQQEMVNDVVIEAAATDGDKSGEVKKTKKNKLSYIIDVVGLVVIAFVAFNYFFIGDNENINMVKNGYPMDYPGQYYGEEFDDFFSNPKWIAFESDSGKEIVEFTGNCLYLEEEVEACIQFTLNKDEGTFDMTYLSFNDIPQNQLMIYALKTAIFEDASI